MTNDDAVRGSIAWPALDAAFDGPRAADLVVQMAHDLRSPLTSILVLAEALRGGQAGPVTEAQRHQLGLIYSAALCLTSAASDVVELARGGKRLTDAHPAPFSMSSVLEGVRDTIQPMATAKKLDLRLVAGGCDQRNGCERALSRVLLNLATNAIKYTDRGFVEIAARDVPHDSSRVEFAVRDSGPGIRPAELTRLCDPFPQHPTTRSPLFSSSGLGLAICRNLLEAMDSSLGVQTAVSEGTRFFFELSLPRIAAAA